MRRMVCVLGACGLSIAQWKKKTQGVSSVKVLSHIRAASVVSVVSVASVVSVVSVHNLDAERKPCR